MLFPIGIFPLLMMVSATLFCRPDWPRRWGGGGVEPGAAVVRAPRGLPWILAVALMWLIPGRFLLFDTDVNWTGRGYRFAWRVMLTEKTGMVDYRVVDQDTGRIWRTTPTPDLTPLQHQHMRTQPDMIRDYALHLARRHEAEGRRVAVYAESYASLNGRPAQRLLRPDVDLTKPLDVLWGAGWVLPLEHAVE